MIPIMSKREQFLKLNLIFEKDVRTIHPEYRRNGATQKLHSHFRKCNLRGNTESHPSTVSKHQTKISVRRDGEKIMDFKRRLTKV